MILKVNANDQTNSNTKSGLLILALALGIKSLLLDYDYLDVYLTLSLQNLFEDHTRWAEHLTQMAKWPYIGLPILISLAFAQFRFGVRSLPLILVSLILCLGLDYTLKLFVYVDKPDSELVYVSHISLASGWPSTFGIIFGSLFGLFVLPDGKPRNEGLVEGQSKVHSAFAFTGLLGDRLITLFSLAVLGAGLMARIILGGHWPTQVLSSMLFGILVSVYFKDIWARWLHNLKYN